VSPRRYARPHEVQLVRWLIDAGLNNCQISRATDISVNAIREWRSRPADWPIVRSINGAPASNASCPRCYDRELDEEAYAYLLGQYLGDGTVYWTGRDAAGRALRISSDSTYPGIIRECCVVIGQVSGRRPTLRIHTDRRMVDIVSSWRAWPCLLPQDGPGRKHSRRIMLAYWQQAIVDAYPGPFLRGLIHSDGWRGVNSVHVKGRGYHYPRYQFSNRSGDIRQLFTYACDLLGIAWRPWGKHHISVARREAVALLDEFVGLKR
jgi:hypothetical protein